MRYITIFFAKNEYFLDFYVDFHIRPDTALVLWEFTPFFYDIINDELCI